MRLAIDIGGTFTDIVLENDNKLITKKVLTSIAQPEIAVIEGILELLEENKIMFSEIKKVNENRNCYRKEEVKQLWVLISHQSAKLNYLHYLWLLLI